MSDPAVYYEADQNEVAAIALTDSGDAKTFKSAVNFWSGRSGYTPTILPNGLISGCVVTPGVANDSVRVTAGTCNLNGVADKPIAAVVDDSLVIARDLTNGFMKSSVTITNAGALAIVDGTAHVSAHSTTRGAAGGPPWIQTDSIEIAQIWITSKTSAVITDAEIKQKPGLYTEMSLSPTWNIQYTSVSSGALGYAGVTFDAAMPEIHSDNAGTAKATKKVYASYCTPAFSMISKTSDFKRPANSKSISSTEYYGGAKGKVSTSLGAGSFKVLSDTLGEGLLSYEGQKLWFKFYPDRLDTDVYVIAQGYLGVTETFDTDGSYTADCVIAAEAQGERVTN
jgi:hypothetical protein